MYTASEVFKDEDSIQAFIDENWALNSVYTLSSGELRDAVVQFIERSMARERFDPDAEFLFSVDPVGDTRVAVRRSTPPVATDLIWKIREARTARKMSQEDLAEQAGYDTSLVKRMESRQSSPRLQAFIDVCQVLGLRVELKEVR